MNGNFTDWSTWSSCSRSCGAGVKERSRDCTSPAPQYGGKNCSAFGAAKETVHCNLLQCPGTLLLYCWLLAYSRLSYSAPFALLHPSLHLPTYTPIPFPWQDNWQTTPHCLLTSSFIHSFIHSFRLVYLFICFVCLFIAVQGNWGAWNMWSFCSAKCGPGKRERMRRCENPAPKYDGDNCMGSDRQTMPCSLSDCPGEEHVFLIWIPGSEWKPGISGRESSWIYWTTRSYIGSSWNTHNLHNMCNTQSLLDLISLNWHTATP